MRLDHVLVSRWRTNEVRQCTFLSKNLYILSLGQFDRHKCHIFMEGGFLAIYDQHERLLIKVKKTLSRLSFEAKPNFQLHDHR